MEFKDWITNKYLDWRGNSFGNDRSVSEFARYLGVSQSLLSRWMSGILKPGMKNAIPIAEMYPEVYSVLGLAPPKSELSPAEIWSRLSPTQQSGWIAAIQEASDIISTRGIDPLSPEANTIRIELLSKLGTL